MESVENTNRPHLIDGSEHAALDPKALGIRRVAILHLNLVGDAANYLKGEPANPAGPFIPFEKQQRGEHLRAKEYVVILSAA
jgi:hypothetical protein